MVARKKKGQAVEGEDGAAPEGHALMHTNGNITNLSIDGNEYEVNEDGDILIPLEYVVAATAHGFTVV